MILTYAVTILIGTFWVCRMISERKIFIRRSFFDVLIALFFLSQLISTFFSIDIHTSLFGYYTRFNGGLLSFACYIVLFYVFISNVEKRDLSKLFLTTFVSALFVSLLAIPEHFGHSASCFMINLYRYQNQELPANWFWQFYDASCWIQDVQTRVFATFGQPNWLAAYTVVLIPLGMALSFSEEFAVQIFKSKTPIKIFYAVTTMALFLSLLFTKSRSGGLGIVIGLGLFGVGLLWRHTRQRVIAGSSFLLLFGVAVLIFGTPFTKNYGEMLFAPKAPAPVVAEATPVNRLEVGGTDSGDIRRIVWSGAVKVWLRYPLFGSGVETFAYSYYQDRPMEHNLVSEWDFLYNKAHNEFLNFLATTGLLGFSTYTLMVGAFILYPLWFVYKNRSQSEETLFAFATAGGLVALSTSNFFGFSTVMVNTLLFLLPAFFVVAYLPQRMKNWSLNKTAKTSPQSPEEGTPFLVLITYAAVICTSAALLFAVYSIWNADFLYNRGKEYIQAGKANSGLRDLQAAIKISPTEPTFYDDLANTYSRVAVALAKQDDATSAAEFANEALKTSDMMLALSPTNLVLYKTQARVYMNLAQIDPKFLINAKATLQKAALRAPTDPKIRYLLGLVEVSMDEDTAGLADLELTIQMKPNYEAAYLSLGEEYEKLGQNDKAKAAYQHILKEIQPNNLDAQQRLASLSAQKKPVKAK